MKWVSTKKNLPPKCREVFLYEESLGYTVGCWDGHEWVWDDGNSSCERRNFWSHWAKPVPPKKEE